MSACNRFFGTPPAPAMPLTTGPTAVVVEPPTPTIPPIFLQPAARRATVSEIVNIVEAKTSAESDFAPVVDGAIIGTGGQVRTGADSRARIELNEGSLIRIGPDTTFTIEAFGDPTFGSPDAIALNLGKVWASLFGGSLQVGTPIGVASVRGSFAIFEYYPGNPDDPLDDVLTVDCIEGNCSAPSAEGDQPLGNLERIRVTKGGAEVARSALGEADVQNFIGVNPDVSAALLAALAAAGNTVIQPSATADAAVAPSATAAPTSALAASGIAILGKHIVQSGESLFCIGRAYGVLPSAIAEGNGLSLNGRLFPGQELLIPAIRWFNIPAGPVCARQFDSPFPAGAAGVVPPPQPIQPPIIIIASPTPTLDTLITNTPEPTLRPTPVCQPPSIYDPVMDLCRILENPTESPPTDTPPPPPTDTVPAPTPTDTTLPSVTVP